MATSPGDRFVRRHNAARSSTSNTTAADISYDTAVLSEGGYSWSSPEVTVDEAGLYLCLFDIGEVQLSGSTRACGTLVPSVNTTDQTYYKARHRYLRNSGGNHGASNGMCFLDLAVNDDVKVRNPGTVSGTDAFGNYATNSGQGGGLQLIRFNAGNFTEVRRTSSQSPVTITYANATRPWVNSTLLTTQITFNSEVRDDDNLYSGSGGDLTLKANKKYAICYGATMDGSSGQRHTHHLQLEINGNDVQYSTGYERNNSSDGPPMQGLYFHEVGGTDETLRLNAGVEQEDNTVSNTVGVDNAYVQILELPDGAEWIHVDNSTTDALTTAWAVTSTYYDTDLSSTFRADGDSDLSLDSGNNAVQNDSGASLPVLAIGWHMTDRDAGASGTRKHTWCYWDNGGTRLAYGITGGYNRGQQGNDDTHRLGYVGAATLDLANGADLSFVTRDPNNANNSDMGVYASGSRYFLGVQVFKLDTLAGSGTDALLAEDIESASEVTNPSIGQEHALLADDVESASEVTNPAVGQEHALLATDIESASEVTNPALAESNVLLAEDVESASEVTAPSIGQEHALNAADVESASEVENPSLGQEHALLANDVESASEVTNPTLSESHILLAEDVESASEVGNPTIGQEHAILAEDVESASEVGNPAVGQEHALLAADVESASEVTNPVLAENIDDLLAEDIESASEVTTPTIGQEHSLNASDVESASEVTTPSVGQEHTILANDVESASEVSNPVLEENDTVDDLLAEDIESASEVWNPTLGQEHALLADDVESASELSVPSLLSGVIISGTSKLHLGPTFKSTFQ